MAVSPRGPKMTLPTQRVLLVMLAESTTEFYGLELGQLTGLAPGTVIPILARLESHGWVDSHWEDQDPRQMGRPRRRYYRLTPDGITFATRALQRVRTPAAPLLTRLHSDPAVGGP